MTKPERSYLRLKWACDVDLFPIHLGIRRAHSMQLLEPRGTTGGSRQSFLLHVGGGVEMKLRVLLVFLCSNP